MTDLMIGGRTLQALLDELRAEHGVVGCTAGVLVDDQLHVSASGLLNIDTGVEATPDSVFQVGSISKAFTATLIMQLVDEGLIGLDDKLLEHLPEFATSDPEASAQITIRQLLSHSSGLDGDFLPADDPEGPSITSAVRKMALLPHLAPAGRHMSYCNAGYTVLGRVVEKRSGMSWADAIVLRILKACGIERAFAHPHESLRFRCAMGHVALDPSRPRELTTAPVTFLPLSSAPAGAVLSMDVAGLLRFAAVHMDDGRIDDQRRLLSTESTRLMREPAIALPNYELGSGFNTWGLGWSLADYPDFRVVSHNGGTIGQFTFLRMVPERKLAIALFMGNYDTQMPRQFEEALLRELAGIVYPPPPPEQSVTLEPRRFVGRYENLSSSITITSEDGELHFKSRGRMPGIPEVSSPLRPLRKDVFKMTGDAPFGHDELAFLDTDEHGRARYLCQLFRMARRVD